MHRTMVTICTASSTFSNSTFCPHSVFMCFVWIWEQTAITSLYSINWLGCITETECVYCAVRAQNIYIYISPPPHSTTAPRGPGPPHHRGFTITLRHTTVSRTPLDEWSAWHSDLYLTTHNTHNRQTSLPLVEFELIIATSERPNTHALDSAVTGIGWKCACSWCNWREL